MSESNILGGEVKIALARIDSDATGVALFQDGAGSVFGLFKDGVGVTVTMNPDELLALGQTLTEAAVVKHANISVVRAAIDDALDRVRH